MIRLLSGSAFFLGFILIAGFAVGWFAHDSLSAKSTVRQVEKVIAIQDKNHERNTKESEHVFNEIQGEINRQADYVREIKKEKQTDARDVLGMPLPSGVVRVLYQASRGEPASEATR